MQPGTTTLNLTSLTSNHVSTSLLPTCRPPSSFFRKVSSLTFSCPPLPVFNRFSALSEKCLFMLSSSPMSKAACGHSRHKHHISVTL